MDTVYNLAKCGKQVLNKHSMDPGNPKQEPSTNKWKVIFQEVILNPTQYNSKGPPPYLPMNLPFGLHMRQFALQLAVTSPKAFGSYYQEGQLDKTTETTAWRAAYKIYGANWKLSKLKLPPPTNKWHHKVHQSQSGMFVRKAAPTPARVTTKLASRTRNHYITFQLCTQTLDHGGLKGEHKAVADLKRVLHQMRKLDPSVLLISKQNTTSCTGATDIWDKFTTQQHILHYVDRCYIQEGRSTWIRFCIGFNGLLKTFTNGTLYQQVKDMGCYLVHKIMDTLDPKVVGFLVGSDPANTNTDDLAEALIACPIINHQVKIECRVRNIMLRQGERFTPGKEVRAVHIFSDKKDLVKCQGLLNTIYGSANKSGLPQGRKVKFIPDTNNTLVASTAQLQAFAQTARTRQAHYIRQLERAESESIIALDTYLAGTIKATLRQVIMSTKANDGQTQLFLHVDHHYNRVQFTFHKDLSQEAIAVINILPRILAQRFGSRAWEWFHADAKTQLAHLEWDEDNGRFINAVAEAVLEQTLQDMDFGFKYFEDKEDRENQLQHTSPVINLELQFNLESLPDTTAVYNFQLGASMGTIGPAICALHALITTNNNNSEMSSLTPTTTGKQNDMSDDNQAGKGGAG